MVHELSHCCATFRRNLIWIFLRGVPICDAFSVGRSNVRHVCNASPKLFPFARNNLPPLNFANLYAIVAPKLGLVVEIVLYRRLFGTLLRPILALLHVELHGFELLGFRSCLPPLHVHVPSELVLNDRYSVSFSKLRICDKHLQRH